MATFAEILWKEVVVAASDLSNRRPITNCNLLEQVNGVSQQSIAASTRRRERSFSGHRSKCKMRCDGAAVYHGFYRPPIFLKLL